MEALRDQYLDLMTFSGGQRPLLGMLFGGMTGLEDSWRSQGATPEELDFSAFGFDFVRIHRLDVASSYGCDYLVSDSDYHYCNNRTSR